MNLLLILAAVALLGIAAGVIVLAVRDARREETK